MRRAARRSADRGVHQGRDSHSRVTHAKEIRMNRTSMIRHLALGCVLAGALLRPLPTLANLCTDQGLPATTSATFLGFGASTKGGNAYALTPFHVTSLEASGPGTLADAVSQGNRYIVFDKGGTIKLNRGILVLGANITIDGCSAPSPGITLYGAGLYLHGARDTSLCNGGCDVHDIIVRNIRTRNTIFDVQPEPRGADGFRVAYGAYNIVFDHVSAQGAGDGNIDITEHSHDVTVSWSIFAAPAKVQLNSLLAYNEWQLTMHHNLFTKSFDRNPDSAFDYNSNWPDPCYCPANTDCGPTCLHPTSNPAQAQTTLDLWNNVVWDWDLGRGTIIWFRSQNNVINNYYYAPGAEGDNLEGLIVCSAAVPAYSYARCYHGDPKTYSWAYVAGNYNPYLASQNIDINTYVGAGNVNTDSRVKPFPMGQRRTSEDACTAAKSVISAGKSPYVGAGAVPIDSVDQTYLSAVTLPGC